MRAYWRMYAFVLAVPATIYLVLFLIGWQGEFFQLPVLVEITKYIGRTTIAILLVLLSIVVGAIATNRVVHQDSEESDRMLHEQLTRAASDFYAVDSSARIDRAHRVFYHLYERGKQLHGASSTSWQEWDRDVQRALKEHCNEYSLKNYLTDTDRAPDFQQQGNPLQEPLYKNAMGHIQEMLESDFAGSIKS